MSGYRLLRLAGPHGFTIIEESEDGITLCHVEQIPHIPWHPRREVMVQRLNEFVSQNPERARLLRDQKSIISASDESHDESVK